MPSTAVIVGSLDTKGAEFKFVKDILTERGLEVLVVDFGVLGEAHFEPEVSRSDVAQAGHGDLDQLRRDKKKDEAMRVMTEGLRVVVKRLHQEGKLDGIIGMGGTGGTSIATSAMRELPVGVPKVMVSTVGGGDVGPYAGAKDIIFVPSLVDVAGINRISRRIYRNGANALAGMLLGEGDSEATAADERPLIAASMFGNTTAAVDRARDGMDQEGFEVLVFHATGIGGKTMESLIAEDYFSGLLDITTTELADQVCGGVFDAGPERCQAVMRKGVPTILVPGCVDMANFGAIETVPDRYRERNLYQWNPNVTLLRTDAAENQKIGRMLAEAANMSAGPVAVVIPLKGVSMLDSEGERFWDPEADKACFEAIKENLNPSIPVHELAHNINDPEFADKCVELLLQMLTQQEP